MRRYSAETDTFEKQILTANPWNKRDFVYVPAPMPCRNIWLPAFNALRLKVGAVVSEDGKTSTRSALSVVQQLLDQDQPFMREIDGSSPLHCIECNLLLDGLPLQTFSVAHFCIANASRTDKSSWMSEAELRCVAISTLSDNNKGMNAVFRENNFGEDINAIVRAGGCNDQAGNFKHIHFTGCMDKKAAEAYAACASCCPWCICPREHQHIMPWAFDAPPPKTWQEYVAVAKRGCAGFVTRAISMELTHAQAGVRCRGCNRVPYQTEGQRLAAKAALAALAASDDKDDMVAYKKQRSTYSAAHFHRHEFLELEIEIEMEDIIVELLHADSLNVAKLLFKWLGLRHCDSSCRERLQWFFAGMKVPIDLRKKGDGRVRGEKWWRASVWDGLVKGSDARPGGLPAWLPTVVFIILHSHVEGRKRGSSTAEINLHKPAAASGCER